MKKILALFAAVVLFSGCATVNTLDKTRASHPERAVSFTFDYPYFSVYAAVKKACKDLKLVVYSEDQKKSKVYAHSHLRWVPLILTQGTFGFGEKVGIYLKPLGEDKTKVEVVLQKANLLDIGYADWRKRLKKAIEDNL